MDLHQFRCVIAVADHGSFTRGAASMHLTQPSVSHAVAKLEAELGERLFVRLPRDVVPTAAGLAFVAEARRAIENAERARAVVQDMTGVVSGRLNLVCVRTAAVDVAQSFARLRRRYPDVVLAAHEPQDDLGVADALRAGWAEVGVMRASMASPDLLSVPLGKEEWVIAMPDRDPPPPPDATLAELAAGPFIALPTGTPVRAASDEFFASKAVVLDVVAEAANVMLQLALVEAGVGAALLPRTVANWIDRPGITIRAVRTAQETEFVVAHARRQLSPVAAAYREMLAL